MKYIKIFWGVILISLSIISLVGYLEDYKISPVFHIINILILLSFGVFFLFFSSKKNVFIEGNKLIVKRGNKNIKELDLTTKERIVHGLKGMQIKFRDFTETFEYKEFNKDSVDKLKSLL